MKRIIARVIWWLGMACFGLLAVAFFAFLGYAFWLDVKNGDWWHMPVSLLITLGLIAVIGGLVSLIMWAQENK